MTIDARTGAHPTSDGYFAASRRPLPTLAFLLPLIVAYEVCLALVLRSGDGLQTNTVEAHRQLLAFFSRVGIAPGGGLHLGGIVIVVVLIIWHFLARDRWRFSFGTIAGMAAEAFALAIPLLLLGSMISRGVPAAGTGGEFNDLDLLSKMAISVGAGNTPSGGRVEVQSAEATHRRKRIYFGGPFGGRFPVMVGDVSTMKGNNPVVLRLESIVRTSVRLFVQEERSLDSEVAHFAEGLSLFIAD